MSESIYNLVPREYSPPFKAPIYRSMHDPLTQPTGSTFGCHGTTRLLGAGAVQKKEGALFGPNNSMTSNGVSMKVKAMKQRTSQGEFSYNDRRKDPTPSVDDKPVLGVRANKNFIVANAVEAILQVPKRLDPSELDYTKKEDFGKVPLYLSEVKREIERERSIIDGFLQQQLGTVPDQADDEPMSEKERVELVLALKKKWEQANSKFQKMSHHVVLDTEGQIRRKEQLERELGQLEADIGRLERPGTILVRK